MLKNYARVLLIESDPEMQYNLRQLLQGRYAIDVAADAASAFILNGKTADLVIANVTPGKTRGASLVRDVRRSAQFNLVPIIVYASPAGEESCVEAMEAGANDRLITPFSSRMLLAHVRVQLRAAQTCDDSFHALHDSEERYRTFMTLRISV
jgi:DNA-binding response OmpR family regulator